MLKIMDNDIYRSSVKVGSFDTRHIWAHDGKKLGYFEDRYVYATDGRKLAWIEGNYLDSGSGSSTRISLDKVNESIVGGLLPEIGRCAIYVLVGA